MEEFIKKYTTLPEKFITDFFIISKEEYDKKEWILDFDLVVKWLYYTIYHLSGLTSHSDVKKI